MDLGARGPLLSRPIERGLDMRRRFASFTLCLTLATATACNSGGSDSPTAPLSARVTVAVTPDPVTARVCACGPLVGELDFDALILFTESMGTAARVESLRGELRSDAGNRVVTTIARTIESGAGQIPGGGTLQMPFALHFPGADAAVPGTLSLTAALVDAAGRRSEASASARVLPPPS